LVQLFGSDRDTVELLLAADVLWSPAGLKLSAVRRANSAPHPDVTRS
jgi:hypothetical protein